MRPGGGGVEEGGNGVRGSFPGLKEGDPVGGRGCIRATMGRAGRLRDRPSTSVRLGRTRLGDRYFRPRTLRCVGLLAMTSSRLIGESLSRLTSAAAAPLCVSEGEVELKEEEEEGERKYALR